MRAVAWGSSSATVSTSLTTASPGSSRASSFSRRARTVEQPADPLGADLRERLADQGERGRGLLDPLEVALERSEIAEGSVVAMEDRSSGEGGLDTWAAANERNERR